MEPKYQSNNSLRMLEIVNPPAPDKGWSLCGGIDPFHKLFIFSEKPLALEKTAGCEAFILSDQDNIYTVVINNRTRGELNQIILKTTDKIAEITLDHELFKSKIDSAGFNF